jgi:nucleoid-associated protein YgaU
MGTLDNIFGKKPEEPKPDFSKVQGGGSSTAVPTPDHTTPASSEERTYVVVAGDSLSRIAKREYGDGTKWPKIYEANTDILKDPDHIHPGQKLRIPKV